MIKEIVICAFNEKTDWVPLHWRPYSIIYVCGKQTKSVEALNKKQEPMSYFLRHSKLLSTNSFHDSLDNLEKLLDVIIRAQQALSLQAAETKQTGELNSPSATVMASNCANLRESEQWLNHIIWRYDVLAEMTFFLQGNPFDHCPDIINLVDQTGYVDFATLPYCSSSPASAGADPNLVLPVYNALFNTQHTSDNAPFIRWAAGAQFVASSERIRSNSKEYYISLQEKMRSIPKSGEIMERIWWNVLGCQQ